MHYHSAHWLLFLALWTLGWTGVQAIDGVDHEGWQSQNGMSALHRSGHLNSISSVFRRSFIFRIHSGSFRTDRPTATRSKSPRSNRRTSSERSAIEAPLPLKDSVRSEDNPTEPTVMVGSPVVFFAQPAALRSEPSNSAFQYCRVESP